LIGDAAAEALDKPPSGRADVAAHHPCVMNFSHFSGRLINWACSNFGRKSQQNATIWRENAQID
jgi:hypothetical protein